MRKSTRNASSKPFSGQPKKGAEAQKALMDRGEREGWEEEFEDFVEEYHISTKIDPRLLSEKQVKIFIRSLLHQSYEQGKKEMGEKIRRMATEYGIDKRFIHELDALIKGGSL